MFKYQTMENENAPLHSIRTDYQKAELHENAVDPDALTQFTNWFQEALKAQVMEPNAMTLSTVSEMGQPNSRIVLLKDLDQQGFVFFTNYLSQKGRELASNNRVSLLFFWPELERQVRILGTVSRVDGSESDKYFQSRPFGSQLGAWASPQSSRIDSRETIEQNLEHIRLKFENQAVIRPEHWGGYRVIPSQMEFWQGRANRLHDRIVYSKVNLAWEIYRIAP